MATAFDDLLPTRVALVEASNPSWWREGLLAQEWACVERLSETRRREFTAGRNCLRAAMATLGLPAIPIPVGPQRAPLLPAGVCGSVTHTDDYCAAAVAHDEDMVSVGIDAETLVDLEPQLAQRILTPAEHALLELPTAPRYGAITLFSVKEAFYKAVYPLCRRFVDFHEVAFQLNDQNSACQPLALSDDLAEVLAPLRWQARSRIADGRVHCIVTIARP